MTLTDLLPRRRRPPSVLPLYPAAGPVAVVPTATVGWALGPPTAGMLVHAPVPDAMTVRCGLAVHRLSQRDLGDPDVRALGLTWCPACWPGPFCGGCDMPLAADGVRGLVHGECRPCFAAGLDEDDRIRDAA